MDFVKTKFGIPQVNQDLANLLHECKAKEETKYAINGVAVSEEEIVATDGRRLFVLACKHSVKPGAYHLTSDGFMLPREDANYPKWKDIVPNENDLDENQITDCDIGYLASRIVARLNEKGMRLNLDYVLPVIKLLGRFTIDKISVFTHKEKPYERPFMITGLIAQQKFTYVQMPLKD